MIVQELVQLPVGKCLKVMPEAILSDGVLLTLSTSPQQSPSFACWEREGEDNDKDKSQFCSTFPSLSCEEQLLDKKCVKSNCHRSLDRCTIGCLLTAQSKFLKHVWVQEAQPLCPY